MHGPEAVKLTTSGGMDVELEDYQGMVWMALDGYDISNVEVMFDEDTVQRIHDWTGDWLDARNPRLSAEQWTLLIRLDRGEVLEPLEQGIWVMHRTQGFDQIYAPKTIDHMLTRGLVQDRVDTGLLEISDHGRSVLQKMQHKTGDL